MMKHAPGPWLQFGYAIMTQDKRIVCDIWADPLRGSESQANASLIAAAPDMLEQLEYCVSLLQCHMPPGKRSIWPGCPESGWLDDYLDAPKAAIAKAKGEAK